MTTLSTELSPRLLEALGRLRVDRGGATVTVEDETIAHESQTRLRQELAGALYRHWHAGIGRRSEERDLRRDHRFEDLLRDATPHRTSKTTAIVKSAILEGPFGRHVLFDVGRVRLQIPEGESPHPLPAIGTRSTLDLPAIRPALSPGFYLVNGSVGGPASGGHLLRVYLHIQESSMAPAVWNAVLAHLEGRQLPYRAKVLAKAADYPRRDAIVLYLAQDAWPVVAGIVHAVRDLPGRGVDHSVLTGYVADGVAYAWEPRDSRLGWDRMSFGQHRTAVIAGAICAGLTDGVDIRTAVSDALMEAGVDPTFPHRNGDTPDGIPELPAAAGSLS